ncbi:MAG: anthrone oxygenase family protein [Pseudomonadota bacterium]
MTYEWTLYLCLFLALWSAVIGGVFSAFSEFIMSGLLRAEPSAGIEAMQHINRTVLKTQFVAGILFIAPLSVFLAIYGLNTFNGAARFAALVAPIVYLPTVFLMTIFGNVPMNKKLDRLNHKDPEAARYWRAYGHDWTRLNHIRTIGSILTAGIYVVVSIALISSGGPSAMNTELF